MQISIEREKANQLEQINKRLESLDEKLKNTVDSRNAVLGAMAGNVHFYLDYLRSIKLSNIWRIV